ncbi:MAG TPA: hypothetical protein VLA34_14000, partial [Candidatus Krumholzibacterium sp.]|nr:hypothetical protein [Candidatus Krumholzibacterium sp.]
MTETVAMGTIIVGAAVFILAGVAKLYGRSRDGMLLSYSFYLISWYGLVLFMMVFFLSPELLPRQSHYGYLLFSSIFIVPMHGAISYFFADVCLSLVGRTMRRSLKMILVAPFIVILVV